MYNECNHGYVAAECCVWLSKEQFEIFAEAVGEAGVESLAGSWGVLPHLEQWISWVALCSYSTLELWTCLVDLCQKRCEAEKRISVYLCIYTKLNSMS